MIIKSAEWVLLQKSNVAAKPAAGLWTMVLDYVAGPLRIKVTAEPTQKWVLFKEEPKLDCGPDGKPTSSESLANCLYSGAPKGCLIAKIGGSSGDYKRTTAINTQILPVGSACVIDFLDPAAVSASPAARGPLFFTMNDEVMGFADHDGKIEVCLWVTKP